MQVLNLKSQATAPSNDVSRLQEAFKINEDSLIGLSQTEQLEWIAQVNQLFKIWPTLKDVQKENVEKEKVLKLSISMTESQEKVVRYRALVATLQGLQTLNLKEIFNSGNPSNPKPPMLRRPKSGRKSEVLPSILHTPQQITTIMQKTSQMTSDQEYQTIVQPDMISPSIISLLLKLQFQNTDKEKSYIGFLTQAFLALKNLSTNKLEQKPLLMNQALTTIGTYFHGMTSFTEYQQEIIGIYTLITALLRNLAVEQISVKKFVDNKLIQKLALNLEQFPKQHELVLNTLRIISKISVDEQCCAIFMANKLALQNVSSFFKLYTNNIYVLIRVTFFLANMTTFYQEMRELLYFEFNKFDDIYVCLEYLIAESQKKAPQNMMDQFGITKSGWDFNTMKAETPQDAMIKVIRLIANLLTVEKIGQDLIANKNKIYIDLVHKLKMLLKKYSGMNKNDYDAISCVLSCLSNLLYYEKQIPISDFNYKNSKIEIMQNLGFFIIQTENEDICCDGLRVISNLSRQKDMIKHIVSNKLLEGLVVLLDTTSLEVVYYCIGVFLNLLQEEGFRMNQSGPLIAPLVQIIKDSSLEQREVVTLALKCLTVISETKISQEQNNLIENSILDYGNKCDEFLSTNKEGVQEVKTTRQLIHNIMNKLPDNFFECTFANCGRKFQSAAELAQHKSRRHKQ